MRLDLISGFFRELESTSEIVGIVDLIFRTLGTENIDGVLFAEAFKHGQGITTRMLGGRWDEDWLRRYRQERLHDSDPVLRSVFLTSSPCFWSEVTENLTISAREEHVMREARRAGLVDGLTVPIFDHSPRMIYVSFSLPDGNITMEGREVLRQIASMATSKLGLRSRRTTSSVTPSKESGQLTKRESECLGLVSGGLKSAEISHILGISARTVDQHIDSSIRRLKAVNRTEAVVIAIEQRLISRYNRDKEKEREY